MSGRLLTLNTKRLFASYALVVAVNGVKNVSPQKAIHVDVRNFPRKAIRLFNYTNVAPTNETPVVIHTMHTKPRRGSRLGTPEKDNQALFILEEDAPSGIRIKEDCQALFASREGTTSGIPITEMIPQKTTYIQKNENCK